MEKRTGQRGMGLVSTLTLLFIVLKLTGLVAWPWVWVLSPLWMTALLAAAALLAILVAGKIKKGRW